MQRMRQSTALAVCALIGAAGALTALGYAQPGDQPGRPITNPDRQPGQPGRDPTLPGRDPTLPGRDPTLPRSTQPGLGNQPGMGDKTSTNIPMKGEKLSRDQVDKLTTSWPATSKKAVQATLDKYGPPDAATFETLVWHNPGPWKRGIVYGTEVNHNLPSQHKDCLMGFIDLKVPVEKIGDLAKFDGSLVYWRTAGELAAICHVEEANFAAINLAHDIVDGSKSVEEARTQLAQVMMAFEQGTKDPITQDFKFDVAKGNQGDPDQPAAGGRSIPGMDTPTPPGGSSTPRRPGSGSP